MSLGEDAIERIGSLTLLAGCLMLIDTVWGAIAVIPFDWSRLSEAVLGISFLIGLPAYLLDVWRKGRVVIFLPAVILLRGFAESYAGSPPALRWQFAGNQLLIVASILLQFSKLRDGGLTCGQD